MSVAVRLGRLLSWVLAVRREAMQLLVSSTSSSGQVGASDAAGIEVVKVRARPWLKYKHIGELEKSGVDLSVVFIHAIRSRLV